MSGSLSDAAAAPAIRVSGLTVGFDGRPVLEDLDLEVRPGEILGIAGGSGSGKSVLLNVILGLIAPSEGSIEILGQTLEGDADRARLDRRLGVMFQNGALFSSLTVQENVEAPLLEHSALRGAWLARIAQMKIALVGLPPDAALKKPAELSGGMRKRVAVARALALDPELLFLDEPTSGLDPISAGDFDRLIRSLSEALELTIVMVTHDLDSLYRVCDRVAVIADRRVAAIGTVAELERSDHPWIRTYFHGERAARAKAGAD